MEVHVVMGGLWLSWGGEVAWANLIADAGSSLRDHEAVGLRDHAGGMDREIMIRLREFGAWADHHNARIWFPDRQRMVHFLMVWG